MYLCTNVKMWLEYTRVHLSYLGDLLQFLQYTIVHLSIFLSGKTRCVLLRRILYGVIYLLFH